MVAIFAMPRLPTPIAMRDPGVRPSPRFAAPSSFWMVEGISAMRRSGNFWWTFRRREKLINPEYGEARRIWETPAIVKRGRPPNRAKAIGLRAFSPRHDRHDPPALRRIECGITRRWRAALPRRIASDDPDPEAVSDRPARCATPAPLAARQSFSRARRPDPCGRSRIPNSHAPIRATDRAGEPGSPDIFGTVRPLRA